MKASDEMTYEAGQETQRVQDNFERRESPKERL